MTNCRQKQPHFNRIGREALLILKKELPRGYGSIIQEKLLLAGHRYSRSMIERVLNPDDNRYSELIIEAAIALRNEYISQKIELQSKVDKMESDILNSAL